MKAKAGPWETWELQVGSWAPAPQVISKVIEENSKGIDDAELK